jgi:hypothetical protein
VWTRTRTITAPYQFVPVLFAVCTAVLLTYLLSLLLVLVRVWRGGAGHWLLYSTMKTTLISGRGLMMPLVYIFLSPLLARQSAGVVAFGVIACALMCLIIAQTSFQIGNFFRPVMSRTCYSQTPPRQMFFSCMTRYVLCVLDVVIKNGWGRHYNPTTLNRALYAGYAAVATVGAFANAFIVAPYFDSRV